MKLSRYQSAVLALACSAGFTHADVVTLKDGKKLEGNITSETPTHIHMRYRLTPKIWDDKDIPRSEIAEGGIVKQKPEEVEILELRKYVPTPDLLSAEKYEQLIQDRLRPFLNRYPGTKEAAEVEKMMADVLEEKEKVVAGGAKLEGKWLSREDAKAESLNIKAFSARAAMLEKIEAKDYSGALQEFDKFLDPKTGFAASVYYPKAVEEILVVLDKYEKQIEQMIREQPTLQKMREESTKKLIEPELTRSKDAIARERDNWKSTYDQERKTTKWFTPYKYDLDSLKTLSKSLSTEKEALKGLDLAVIGKVNEAIARMVRADAKAGKDKAELAKMGEAIVEGETAAANADATSKQFYRTVFTMYRERHAYFTQVLATAVPTDAQPATTGAAGGSSAIAGTATPGMDSKVAAALAAASGGAPAPAGTPGAVGTVPGAQPGVVPGAVAPGVQPGVAPGVVPGAQPGMAAPGVQPGVAPGAYPQPPAMPAPAPAAEEEEGMSTTTMILIGAGVVVLVILLTLLGGGKKKK
ncbi:PTPDL family protein [Prosthecobacter sp.]|uniref:PTPDL family protein n=1 Tax=Prosthecobacter sp. TaxID=1965333 RepID=UPI003784E825